MNFMITESEFLMNERIRDYLFCAIVCSIVFNNIHRISQLSFFSGSLNNKLVFFPLFISLIYTIFCHLKNKNTLVEFKEFFIYVGMYVFITLASFIVGIIQYPYWNDIFSGPINQIEKIPRAILWFQNYDVNLDVKVLTRFWIIVSGIKGIFVESFWYFGSAYMFYCWYRKDYKKGLNIACFGVIVSSLFFSIYGIIDALFLAGNLTAEKILINVNPYLYQVERDNGWWPPLLWYGQLRSIFSEPSHTGNLLAVVFPVLFFCYLKYKHYCFLLLTYIISFLVVLTKARTAYAMFFGTLFLILILCFDDIKKYIKSISIMIGIIIIGFFSSIYYLNYINVYTNKITNHNEQYSVKSVLNDNLFSLLSADKRSNGARYALIKTNLRIASQYPLLGVGTGLGKAYMINNYTESEKANEEVAMWIRNTEKYGICASGQGLGSAMNEFITRLSQTGIIGLSVYLLPFLVTIYRLLIIGIKEKNIDAKMLAVIMISILVSGCNGSVNVIYSIWIFLGISFALIHGELSPENYGHERT